MSEPSKAVFLSYASQDAAAATRICEALRAAGVEVWFDQSELVGGDAWDQKIRKQIGSCALFVPVISASTQARAEGYFRLEWKLADRRTDLIGKSKAFLLPVCIDGTRDSEADVPDSFLAVQWTKLPGGEPSPAFVARVKKLLEGGTGARDSISRPPVEAERPIPPRRSRWPWAAGTIVALVTGYMIFTAARDPSGDAATAPSAMAEEKSSAALSPAREMVAKAWDLMTRPGMAREELDVADDLCKRAAAIDSNDAEVWAAWSQVDSWYVYHRLERTPARQDGARTKAARALNLSPQSYEARLAQACYLVREGGGQDAVYDLDEAESLLRTLLRENPDEPRALLALGVLYRNTGKVTEFRDAFARMAAAPRFAAQAYNELGWAEFFHANYNEAHAAAEASIKLQPYYGNLVLKTYLLEYWWGNLEQARLTLDRIPATNRLEDYAITAQVELSHWRRDPDGMLQKLDRFSRDWIESNAFDGPKAWWSGLAHQIAGREEAARQQWRAGLRAVERRLLDQPDSSFLLRWKARLLLASGSQAEGEVALRLARQMGSRDYFSNEVIDEILLGNLDAAIAVLEQGVGKGVRRLTAAHLRLQPAYDPLRDRPRFQALLAKTEADPRFSPHARPASAVEDKSVAVLAFANLSDDKANEYFSDGISEELLNVLAKVPGLKVSARTSAFHFKGKDTPIPEIARQLGVAYVVEGSVRKQGDRVRITAQLIKAADGFHVWSDTFTRDLKDIFAVQDEIAGLIAQNLQLKLGTASTAATATVNPEALRLYLEGRQIWTLRSPAALDRAETLFTEALRLDPAFARARSGLADVWINRGNEAPDSAARLGVFSARSSPEIKRIIGEAEAALRMDPQQAETHATVGHALWPAWDATGASRSLRRAIELNPNYATAHQWLGRVLLSDGQMTEALASLARAAELDPLSPIILDNYGMALLFAGRPADALPIIDRALVIRPDSQQTQAWKIWALTELGQHAEALMIAQSFADRADQNDMSFAASYGLWRAGSAEAAAYFAQTQVGYRRFLATVGSGQQEKALEFLDVPSFSHLHVHYLLFLPALDPVRPDPRFQSAIVALGLEVAHARAQAWRAANPPRKPLAAE